MNTISERPTNTRTLTPKGAHVAKCITVIDLGTGPETWKGETKTQRKINVTWALPKCLIEIDGEQRPMTISKKYTASMDPKATLRKHVDTWLSLKPEDIRKFDPEHLLGKSGLVTVTHYEKADGETGASVSTVTSLPEGLEVPEIDLESWTFDPSDPRKNWDKLREWQRERVSISHEYKAAKANGKTEDETDSIPF